MCNWDEDLICRYCRLVVSKLDKPILKLTDEDYAENSLSDLIIEHASAYDINIRILTASSTPSPAWPGGKAQCR